MTTTHPYPTSTLDRLQLRADEHAECKPVRRRRQMVATPVLINRATREVQHWESQARERDDDVARLLLDETAGPDSSRTQRAIESARYAREELVKAERALAALARVQGITA